MKELDQKFNCCTQYTKKQNNFWLFVILKKKQQKNLEVEEELIHIFHQIGGSLPTKIFIFVVHQPVHGLHHLQDLFFILFFFLRVCVQLQKRYFQIFSQVACVFTPVARTHNFLFFHETASINSIFLVVNIP